MTSRERETDEDMDGRGGLLQMKLTVANEEEVFALSSMKIMMLPDDDNNNGDDDELLPSNWEKRGCGHPHMPHMAPDIRLLHSYDTCPNIIHAKQTE